MRRQCTFHAPSGEPCKAAPLRDSEFCLMHSPEHAQEVQAARRLGGLRRKREATVSVAYDFAGLETVAGIRRLIHVAVIDTIGMENSISRNRTLAYLAQVALRTLEVGDIEGRIAALEQLVGPHAHRQAMSAFDFDLNSPSSYEKEEI